MNGQTVKKAMP